MQHIHDELHDFLHSPGRLLAAMAVLLFGAVIAAQWLYPADRTVPFATVDGRFAGSVQRDELMNTLHERYDRPMIFKAGSAVLAKEKFADIGLTPQYAATVDAALDYPWWERSIPFSLLARQWSMGNIAMQFQQDDVKIYTFVKEKLLPACEAKAVSATIAVKKGELSLEGGRDGRSCSKDKILTALFTKGALGQEVAVPYTVVHPKRQNEAIKPLFEKTKKAFSGGMAIEVDGTIHTFTAKEVVSWLFFQEDKKTHQLKPAVNEGRAKTALITLQKKFYKTPEARTVYLLDGVQQRQEAGKAGRTIAIDPTLATIRRALLTNKAVVQATTQVVVPETRYVNNYSLTSVGLSALLQNLAREKGNYAISVIELDGRQRRANANGTTPYTTASTYKIFVAYSVLKEIEAGRIKWGQPIRDGMNTEACWDEMLVYSLNPCSWTFADMVGGWGRIEQQAHANGLTSTFLNAVDKRSTANDEAAYFAKLEKGTLLQGASRQRLLDTLKIQHYRSGIPAGTGVTVADKIGFLDGYLHDVGIVYGPKGRYVLAVMTNGGSWWGISDVARQVHAYMQR